MKGQLKMICWCVGVVMKWKTGKVALGSSVVDV